MIIVDANNVVACWNVSEDNGALKIGMEAIQVSHRAASDLLRSALDNKRSPLVDANTTCWQFPDLVLELSHPQFDLRQNEATVHDGMLDPMAIANFSHTFGNGSFHEK